MRKLLIIAAALTAGTLSLNAIAEDMKATGTVTEVDKDTHEITINDQKYVMPLSGGGAAMMPQVGADITLYYEDKDGQKTITRIGQAQQ